MDALKRFITEILNPTTLWGMLVHDLGHPLTGAAAGGLALWLGADLLPATLIATVGVPVLQEAIDFFRFGAGKVVSTDSIHDIATYQLAWLPMLVGDGNLAGVYLLMLLLATTEASFYKLSIKL